MAQKHPERTSGRFWCWGSRAKPRRDAQLAAAVALCHRFGAEQQSGGSESEWRGAFLQAPYLRDLLVSLGVMAETFETAVTWDRLYALIEQVRATCQAAVERVVRSTWQGHLSADPRVSRRRCPLLHGPRPCSWWRGDRRVGPDQGPASAAPSSTAGGTITHHHAVGRDHVPWYVEQQSHPFGLALEATKRTLDPARILNPGVLGL